jgi:hypothetical protein
VRNLTALRRRRHFLEEDAVVQSLRRAAFLEAVPIANPPAVFFQHVVARHLQMRGETIDLEVADPDVPRRARATVPALAAREFQTLGVPGFLSRGGFDDVELHDEVAIVGNFRRAAESKRA